MSANYQTLWLYFPISRNNPEKLDVTFHHFTYEKTEGHSGQRHIASKLQD